MWIIAFPAECHLLGIFVWFCFCFCLLVFFHQALWLTRKKKKCREEGLILTGAGFELATQKGEYYECKKKKENGCFILLWGRDLGQVKLRALIWEWCYYRSLGVGYALNWEAGHMRRQQRRITWGSVGALLQWSFIFFTTRLKCTSVTLRNQVTLLAGEHSLLWPNGCFINEPVLPICVLSGALFRYWNLFSD